MLFVFTYLLTCLLIHLGNDQEPQLSMSMHPNAMRPQSMATSNVRQPYQAPYQQQGGYQQPSAYGTTNMRNNM